jgi:hypothetical protein
VNNTRCPLKGLVILDPQGADDAPREIAYGPDLRYTGCRNGFHYAFAFDGRQRWKCETLGVSKSTDSAWFRPCPY